LLDFRIETNVAVIRGIFAPQEVAAMQPPHTIDKIVHSDSNMTGSPLERRLQSDTPWKMIPREYEGRTNWRYIAIITGLSTVIKLDPRKFPSCNELSMAGNQS
jgi:hypothetical protein